MAETSSTVFFLILRRMRAPLIVLITIFAVSVLGLTLIPGRDAAGQPTRMGFFDAFYFMSYTATTIGYGEIPHPFTDAQRLWVMATIYLTVIGWAYAIGSLLTLMQDRAFRQALGLQRFIRRVSRLREPFLLIVGYGQTGQLLGHSLDAIGSALRRARRVRGTRQRARRRLVPRRRTRAGRRRRRSAHPGRRRFGTPPVRGSAGAHRQRRGQPGRRDDRRPGTAGPAGRRPDRLMRRSSTGCVPSARRRSSTRSTASATTWGSHCVHPRRTG
nr:hypothetical protein GCM10020092_081530 [Actinoplanes digitatis]